MRFCKNKHILVFYGVDGSGKSTLAYLLADTLRKYSYHAKIIRLRGHHTIMYVIMRFVFWIKGVNYRSIRGRPLHLNYITMKYFRTKKLYILFEIIGVLMWFILKLSPFIILCRDSKSLIIADRYIPDFAVLISFTADISNKNMTRLVWFLEKIQPLKPLYFYIYADLPLVLRRKMEEHLTESFCSFMILKYQAINKYLNPIPIDTSNRKPEEIIPEILKELEKHGVI